MTRRRPLERRRRSVPFVPKESKKISSFVPLGKGKKKKFFDPLGEGERRKRSVLSQYLGIKKEKKKKTKKLPSYVIPPKSKHEKDDDSLVGVAVDLDVVPHTVL